MNFQFLILRPLYVRFNSGYVGRRISGYNYKATITEQEKPSQKKVFLGALHKYLAKKQ